MPSFPDKIRFKFIIDNIKDKSKLKILDLGVGEGELHAELIKQFGKEKLVGLDFEDYCMIRYNKYQITSPDVVHNLNIFPYPFSNN